MVFGVFDDAGDVEWMLLAGSDGGPSITMDRARAIEGDRVIVALGEIGGDISLPLSPAAGSLADDPSCPARTVDILESPFAQQHELVVDVSSMEIVGHLCWYMD